VEPEVTRQLPISPPAVWLPVDQIANSPSQPLPLNVGPYQQQMLYGDVTYGGLNRVVLHKVAGQYQGCALPFTQGFEAGINRAVTAPDGSIFVGGIGNPGNWAQEGKLWYGFQRLVYTGAPTFELLDLELRSDGIELRFTEPLRAGDGDAPEDYLLKQWTYLPTADYGGPKIDERVLPVQSVHLASDRSRVFLAVAGIEPGHVVHIQLEEAPRAQSGRALWAADAFCTVNALPLDQPGQRTMADVTPPNALSASDRQDGFRLLFDGKSTVGWQGYRGAAIRGWTVKQGWLTTQGKQGSDLVSKESFGDFELEFEWKVEPGANGGVFYRAGEGQPDLWAAGIELQILDDEGHPDGKAPLHRAGAAYDLFAPTAAVTHAPGEINRARIVARGTRVEHWLNGHRVLAYDTSDPSWSIQLRQSKFAGYPGFGEASAGHIGLQHHGAGVAYRNLKLRALTQP
jgi:cytochrome c